MLVIPCYAVINSLNEMLLLQRSHICSHPYQFVIPGGKTEEGETEWEAARRELLEETGIKAVRQDNDYLGSYTNGLGFAFPTWALYVDAGARVIVEPTKFAGYGWFSLEQQHAPALPMTASTYMCFRQLMARVKG